MEQKIDDAKKHGPGSQNRSPLGLKMAPRQQNPPKMEPSWTQNAIKFEVTCKSQNSNYTREGHQFLLFRRIKNHSDFSLFFFVFSMICGSQWVPNLCRHVDINFCRFFVVFGYQNPPQINNKSIKNGIQNGVQFLINF